MKKFAKRFAALLLSAALLTAPAGAINAEGESETWFDGVWALIDAFSLKTESDPYVLQNYINKYLEKHPEEMYTVINEILGLLDTHSMYLSAEEYTQGFSTLEGYVGIGVGMEQAADGIRIAEVIAYSAAEEAGLQVGDRILSIAGKDMRNAAMAEAAELLRGEAGTAVEITVERQGKTLTVTCTRRQINRVYVSNKTLADGVEYIKVSAMGSENDWTAFSQIWEGLDEKNTRAVILDLRGNGGGVINVAMKMADAMVREKDQYLAGVHWRKDMGGLEQTYSTGGALPLNKIVVLADGGTASAAELLTGSLKDTGTATVIGTKTYGKGQGQYHFPLVNGDRLVITTLEMELPKTGVYEGVGITPDLTISNRQVTVNAASLQPLDTGKALRYGESADDVYAMTERLALLGLMDGATRTFDSATLDAVTAFLSSYEMAPASYASPAMLEALADAVQALDGQTYLLDDQLQTALEMCKLAAGKPQQYVSLPDGGWRAK